MKIINYQSIKKHLKAVPIFKIAAETVMEMDSSVNYRIPEVEPINFRKAKMTTSLRLNLLIPSVDEKHVFGGIATALRFFEALRVTCDCSARIIITDAEFNQKSSKAPDSYEFVSCDKESDAPLQLVPFSDRSMKTIPVAERDVFFATGWWTAYTIQKAIVWQKAEYGIENPLLYFIQDYEPGFYPWSSRYLMADSTYRFPFKTYAIINSGFLNTFLINHGYRFDKSWYFDPVLNPTLREKLPTEKKITKKKQLLVYGRPGTERNAFSLIVYALKEWVQIFPNASEWSVISAGESHIDIDLGNGVKLKSLGKLTLDQYAEILKDSYAGVSLMVSPHPSYPPLEMSTFGVRTITNTFENKELSSFNDNIISLTSCGSAEIAEELAAICRTYNGSGNVYHNDNYLKHDTEFDGIPNEIKDLLIV